MERNRSAKLVSFPWIWHQQLSRVAKVLREHAIQRESEGWEVGTSTTGTGEADAEDDDEGWHV